MFMLWLLFKIEKEVVIVVTAYGCAHHPKAGHNTQQLSPLIKNLSIVLLF